MLYTPHLLQLFLKDLLMLKVCVCVFEKKGQGDRKNVLSFVSSFHKWMQDLGWLG